MFRKFQIFCNCFAAIFHTTGDKASHVFESKDESKYEENEQMNTKYRAEKDEDCTQEKMHVTFDDIVNASSDSLEYIQAIPGENKKGAKNVQRKVGET